DGERGDSIRYHHTMLLSALVMCEALSLAEGTLWCSSIKVRMTNGKIGRRIGKKEIGILLRFCHSGLLGVNHDVRSSGPCG
ncbi:hypothetical protein J1N35_007344, partial [Gossypium stocksii]